MTKIFKRQPSGWYLFVKYKIDECKINKQCDKFVDTCQGNLTWTDDQRCITNHFERLTNNFIERLR